NLSATEATFNVGNVGSDRMLCLAQRTGAVIPVAKYEASLKAVSAAPTTYAVGDLGPSAAGDIDRDGTELQAPLVQVPQGWLARIALTNTGTVARSYTIRTLDAANEDDGSAGKKLILNTITGTLPGNGTKVIRLNDDALDLATGGRRGTVIVTVDGPKGQIEGLYQVVNPNNGLVNNHIMTK
ncbi:MAG: hypothetical protein J0H45_10315, partial [Stenotrophomonas nitritireducens]|nr:hypothetical protein [Stenotrophomonas nitritireducens]